MSTDVHEPSSGLAPSTASAEELRSICSDIWACYVAQDVEVSPASATPLLNTGAGADLVRLPGCVAAISVTGAWNGEVRIELTGLSAHDAARRLLDHADDTELLRADLLDAIGELANMVGGNFKGLVSAPSQLGLPIVTAGGTPARDPLLHQVLSVDVCWAEHRARVTVSEHEVAR